MAMNKNEQAQWDQFLRFTAHDDLTSYMRDRRDTAFTYTIAEDYGWSPEETKTYIATGAQPAGKEFYK